ncbi:hypothetical protein [Halocola ammonii]
MAACNPPEDKVEKATTPTDSEKEYRDRDYFSDVMVDFKEEHFHDMYSFQDSVEIKSLQATVYLLWQDTSHGTDYLLIRNHKTKQIISVPISRAWFKTVPETDDVLLTMKRDSISFKASQLDLGIEQFLNQPERSRKKAINPNQLDSILSIHPHYSKGRIHAQQELEQTLISLFERDSIPSEGLQLIIDSLSSGLKRNKTLICNQGDAYLDVFQLPPDLPEHEQELNRVVYWDLEFYRLGSQN